MGRRYWGKVGGDMKERVESTGKWWWMKGYLEGNDESDNRKKRKWKKSEYDKSKYVKNRLFI